jgi:hypothetical protein
MARPAVLLLVLLAWAPGRAGEIRTPHFLFRFDDAHWLAVEPIVRVAEAELVRLALEQGAPRPGLITVDVTDTLEEFAARQGREADDVDWAVGITDPRARRILLRIDKTHLFTLEETFLHEVSHAVLLGGVARGTFPRWFSEGLAIAQSGEPLANRLKSAMDAATTHSLLPLEKLDFGFPAQGPALHLAYAESGFFVRGLLREHGPGRVRELIRTVRREGRFWVSFEKVLGVSVEEAERRFARGLEQRSSWLRVLTDDMLLWGLAAFLMIFAFIAKRRQISRQIAAMPDGPELADDADEQPPEPLSH